MATLLLIILYLAMLVCPAPAKRINHSIYTMVMECVACHPRALPTHKQRTPRHMEEKWPLGRKGEMLCLTCHNCSSGSCVLRNGKPELCRNCHDCTEGMACVLGVAHLGNIRNPAAFIDGCLSCHDGSIAPAAGGPGEHSVNVFYIASKDFKRPSDRRIVLINGKVTCVSCHNPYRSEKDRLVRSSSSGNLCLACHRR